ncbi:zinc c6 finger domain protein [Ophiostoma piceae UAMH 11346]|uniref:Zinc c6 finger domain protein n=1 Tax=Ophiostoma piceae (strain UAMH 11346) TaxID=1262450 RepID=S3BQH8_OPHP1|nr:zinc c6 finger domain protein [Ophiostoma piceae UAMH 11346]
MSQAEKKAPAAKKVRSRAGCTRCRRQRKRCDEQKPACARCQEVSQPCSYELNIKWGGRAFPKMLGTYAGRVQRLNNADEGGGFVYVAQPQQGLSVPRHTSDTAAVASPSTHPSHPQPTRMPAAEYTGESEYKQTFDEDDQVIDISNPETFSEEASMEPFSEEASMAVARQGRPWEIETDLLSGTDFNRPGRSLEFAPDLSRIHRFLLNHYVHDTIRLTAPSDYARTEICRSVVPMSYDQPCLLFAMMAFAARHLNSIGALPVGDSDLPGDDAEEVISDLEDRSMSSLRQQLTEPNFNQHVVALATTRTLCQSQILAAGDSWRTHLEGARAILQAASSQAKSKSKSKSNATTRGEPGNQKSPDRDQHENGEPSIQDYLASWYNNVEALAALTPLGLRRGQLEMANVLGRRNVYFDVFGGLVSDVPDLFREVGALVMERRRRMKRARENNSSNDENEEKEDEDDDNDAGDIDRSDTILSDDDIALEAESLVQNIHKRLEQDTIGNLRMDNNLLVSLSPDNMHDYAMSNASFLHTALLYLHCAVQCLPLSAPEVRHSVEQIVWCYGNMKSASALSPRVLMGTPLFTAGLWAMPDAQVAIRGYFATMGTWMRTPHNVRSSAVLEFVWSKTSSPHHHHDVLTYLDY